MRYRPVWREKIPYALLGAAAGAGAWLAQRVQPDTMLSTAEWSGAARFLQAAYGLCFYVWKTVWPTNLAAMYELPARLQPGRPVCVRRLPDRRDIVAAAIVPTARTHPEFLAAAIVYVATVAPVLGFAQSGPQLVADRYAYVSSLAFSAIVAGGLLMLSRRSVVAVWRRPRLPA